MLHQEAQLIEPLRESGASRRQARIVSSIRWTLWLSILSAPCGYLTSILLARVGPEAIGTYGMLSLYVAFTSVFLFLGGPAVVIRFLPELSIERRLSFVYTYFAILCAAALPYQLVAILWPQTLRLIIGNQADALLRTVLIWGAPIYLLFSLSIAALKAILAMKEAQMLARAVTIGSCALYSLLFFAAPRVLATQMNLVIWGSYFALTMIVTVLAIRYFVAACRFRRRQTEIRFFLPQGFWRYTLSLQASSALGFLSTRLDCIFVLAAGGVGTLGRYVALMTLVSIVPMFATFLLDSLLPSLANTLAEKDLLSSRALAEVYLRIILLSACGAGLFLLCFADAFVGLLGPRYADLRSLLPVALPVAIVQVLNYFVGTIFSAAGIPEKDAIGKAVRTVVYCCAFWMLWERFQLAGAIWAWAVAEVIYQVLAIILLFGHGLFRFTFWPTYRAVLAIHLMAAALAVLVGPFPVWLGLCGWLAGMTGFLIFGKYTTQELIHLARLVMPTGRVACVA